MSAKPSPYATERWWNDTTVAVVTGGNKGIGAEIARLLAEQGVTTVVTARNEALGQAATKKIAESAGPNSKVAFHRLDISDKQSVEEFAQWLQAAYGHVNILVNNAGIAFKGNTFGADEAAQTLDTNFRGTMYVCERLKPLLSDNARIVNVCSRAGTTKLIKNKALLERFTGATSKEELVQLADKFVADIRANTYQQEGWPQSMYGISKLTEAQYTRVLADELKSKGIMVNALCPGYCATDMSSWGGTSSAADGADTPVWLALRPPGDFVTGGFFAERKQIPL